MQSARAFRPAAPGARPARQLAVRVRAEATEAAAPAIEKSATYFTPKYDIEKIKTILPHRWALRPPLAGRQWLIRQMA